MPLFRTETARILAAGSAAAFAAAAFAAIAAEPAPALADIEIGEKGDVLRVALICSRPCELAPVEGGVRLKGVRAKVDIDLAARSALAERLTVVPDGEESLVRLTAASPVRQTTILSCEAATGPAPCIEYRFGARSSESAQSVPLRDPTAETAATSREPPFIGALTLDPAPGLRDEPAAGVVYLDGFAPPERLSPPAAATPAAATPEARLPVNVDVRRPTLLSVDRAEALGQGPAFDFRAEAMAILGKSMSVGDCEGAKARLQADAWALDAMIDAAFCKAGEGRLDAADADFSRLLAYTPDNYEALVGRGLIAFAVGDRDRGKALFQDALNALPPIAESDRIVEAMERN